jgi:hypothetical protein
MSGMLEMSALSISDSVPASSLISTLPLYANAKEAIRFELLVVRPVCAFGDRALNILVVS